MWKMSHRPFGVLLGMLLEQCCQQLQKADRYGYGEKISLANGEPYRNYHLMQSSSQLTFMGILECDSDGKCV
jgi:hypothetical protein